MNRRGPCSVVLAGAAGALLAGSAAAQIPSNAAERLKLAPASTFAITAQADEGGEISPTGTISVQQGATQQFELVPNSGWAVRDVAGCYGTGFKTAGGRTTYTTGRVSGNCNALVSFVRLQPQVTAFKINNDAAETPVVKVVLRHCLQPLRTPPGAAADGPAHRTTLRALVKAKALQPCAG